MHYPVFMDEPLCLNEVNALFDVELTREAFLANVAQPFLDNFAAKYGLTRDGLTLDRDLRFINHSDER